MKINARLTAGGLAAVRDLAKLADPRPVTAEELNDTAQQVFAVSQRYVPVDTGFLKGSGETSDATARNMVASVQYTADYALVVHEIHPSKSGYLFRAADLVLDNLPKRLADAIVARSM